MAITDIFSLFSVDAFHKFSFFLGTDQGEFFKRSIELVIYTMLSYMIISEYKRSKRLDLKYLMIAFVSLMVHRVILVVYYATLLFTHVDFLSFGLVLPVFLSTLEIITVIILVNAFTYTGVKERTIKINIEFQIFIALVLAVIVEVFWIIANAANANVQYSSFFGNMMFNVVQLVLILFALYHLTIRPIRPYRYNKRIYFAFCMYLVTPFLHLVNIVFYGNENLRLRLIEQPFPFIAIILFTQVIYLKLVDKAYLKGQLEETQKRYQEEKEINKMKDEFVSTVSHELRTPITSIKLYLGLLLKGKFGNLNQKQSKAVHTVQQENDRLTYLIHDLLALSRLESGKETLHYSKFKLKELDNPMYRHLAKEKKIKLSFKIPERTVVVDQDKIKQVFLNLLNNAIKFTPAKGKIDIVIKVLKTEWSLAVKDSGIGIKKQDLKQIFEKFHQVGDHMTRTQKGTGLGLAITKKIVNMHQGTISVESVEGKGSTFTVRIPLDSSSKAEQ